MALNKFTNIVNISDTTDGGATNTGALVINGGIGCAKNIMMGSALTMKAPTGTNPGIYFNHGNTQEMLLYRHDVGGLSFYDYNAGDPYTWLTQYNPGGGIIKGYIKTYKNVLDDGTGGMNVTGTSDASSISTGSLVVSGGVGIAGKLYVGGDINPSGIMNPTGVFRIRCPASSLLYLNDTTDATLSLCQGGGMTYIHSTAQFQGVTTITNTTESSSVSTGACICNGGIGCAKKLYVGGQTIISNTVDSGYGVLITNNSSSGYGVYVNNFGSGDTFVVQKSNISKFYVSNVGTTVVADTAVANTTYTGALVVAGGVGIAKSLYVKEGIYSGTSLSYNNYDLYSYPVNRWALITAGAESTGNAGSDMQLHCYNDGGAYLNFIYNITRATGQFSFAVTTEASSVSTGSVIFNGGVGIAKKLFVGGGIYPSAATGCYIGNYSNLRFQDSGTSSSWLVYDYDGNSLFEVVNNLGISAGVKVYGTAAATSSSTGAFVCNGGVSCGSCAVGALTTGTVYSNAQGVLNNSASDERLKTEVQPITYGLTETNLLAPKFFKWIDTNSWGTERQIGFIANQVQSIIPEAVGQTHNGYLTLEYPKLTAVLCKAIQELDVQKKALEVKVSNLESICANFETRIKTLEG